MAVSKDVGVGYDTFAPGGDCSLGTCAAFKQQLSSLFTDFEALWTIVQKLGCIDNPQVAIRQMDTTLFQSLFDKAPNSFLFSMKRFLALIPV